ncbi:MAG: acyl-CoA/acyl-ACP dehydrogenase [Dehalococcoidales bacterium]|nr:acyl-CoA/acyl-ACP dehydrogenase [Dehalococcoidales bacterium]
MDLSFTAEQKKLQESARDFLKRECPWTLIKELDDSESGFSTELWGKITGLGWGGMPIPAAYGGSGKGVTEMGLLGEEMGKALFPDAWFSSAVLCGSIISGMGTEKQKQALLPEIASGKKIYTLAFTEPDYGWDPESIQLSAKAKGKGFVLNGTKRFVYDVQIADQIICVARTRKSESPENGITLFLVDKNAKGLSCRNLSGTTGSKLNELTFNAVEVPESNIIGARDNAWVSLHKSLNRATVVLCAYMVGGCQYLLEMTTEFAQNRVQFGQPIGAFQWVQGYVIGQANNLERARWFTYEAMWKLDAGKPQQEQDEAVSLAKAVASQAFHDSAHLAHEVCAGKGIQKGFPLYLYSQKAKSLYSYLGDPYHHRKHVSGLLNL